MIILLLQFLLIYFGNVTELANVPDLKSVRPKGHVGSRPTVVVYKSIIPQNL